MPVEVVHKAFLKTQLPVFQTDQIKNALCDPIHLELMVLVREVNHLADLF
jgi:hypothetical protein